MNQTLPVETGNTPAPPRVVQAHDLAEACVHLDASVLAARRMSEHLNESWSVLRRHLGDELLDLIAADPGFRLDDRMVEAMDTHFAENALIEVALRRRWCVTQGIDKQIVEAGDRQGILARIHAACAR